MTKQIMEVSHAVAEGAKMIKPGVVAAYPITPQTHIVERISDFVADGEMDCKYIRVESEFSAISACLGASATGVRTYTSTSSQGLALMFEVLFVVSGMRLPVGMTVANRALSAPINIWGDQQDSFSVRDSGWIQMHAETAQEAFDLTLMQYKISEDHKVMLPSMVCIDGFTLSHVYEPAYIPSQKKIDDFLPEYKPYHAVLDPKEPLTLGPIGFPSHYMELRYDQKEAIENSDRIIKDVFADFSDEFPVTIKNSRPERYGHLEKYKVDDAEIIFLALGSVCGTIKVVIDGLRKKGEKVGLVKVRTYRPFPREEIKKTLKGAKKVAVLEKAISPGGYGHVFEEVRSSLYQSKEKPEEIRNFIIGLGGRDVTQDNIKKIYEFTKKSKGKTQEFMF